MSTPDTIAAGAGGSVRPGGPVEVFGPWVTRLLAAYGLFCGVISYGTVRAAALALGAGELFAAVAPLGLDLAAVVFCLAYLASVRRGQPDTGMRTVAHALIAATVAANAWAGWREGGAYLALLHAVFPAALGVLVERFARVERRAAAGVAGRVPARLWFRHPVRSAQAALWLARQSAPAFDRARAERDRMRDARAAVRLAMPGRRHRAARATVLRQLDAGRLTPAAAVAASGLLTRADVPELHRAALVASLGGTPAHAHGRADARTRALTAGTPALPPGTGNRSDGSRSGSRNRGAAVPGTEPAGTGDTRNREPAGPGTDAGDPEPMRPDATPENAVAWGSVLAEVPTVEQTRQHFGCRKSVAGELRRHIIAARAAGSAGSPGSEAAADPAGSREDPAAVRSHLHAVHETP